MTSVARSPAIFDWSVGTTQCNTILYAIVWQNIRPSIKRNSRPLCY